MFRGLTAVLVAAGTVWGLADRAEAFHHVVRARCIAYYPGLYSFGCCGCPPCPPPPYTYPCVYRYPKFCGHFKSCWNGRLLCATGCRRGGLCGFGCGYGCFGCGVGGCAPRGYGYCGGCGTGCGACGSSCGACGDGSCGTGGCDSCGGGNCQIGGGASAGRSYQTDEKVLYDGPAPGPEQNPAPEPDPSAGIMRSPFHLASSAQRDGSNDFARGLRAYWDNNMTDALRSFEAAAAAEPHNALYHYYRALALYNLSGAEAAGEWLQQAVELEREAPVANWGRRMERVQGRPRLWLEQARQNADLGR